MCSNLVEIFSKRTSNMGEVFTILELNIRRRLVFTCMFIKELLIKCKQFIIEPNILIKISVS